MLAPFLLAFADYGYTMRLNLHKGQSLAYKLEIDRGKQSGALYSKYTISSVKGDTMTMSCRLIKLTINGKDRTKDLKDVLGDQTATLPWTNLSRRTGMLLGFHMKPGKPDVMSYLQEAGIYLAYFQPKPVKPGDSWNGSTTATGGCTSGTFTLKKVQTAHGKQLAYFDVDHIMFVSPSVSQEGPMHMIVDLATGLPTVVDYKVRDSKSKAVTHFRQTTA